MGSTTRIAEQDRLENEAAADRGAQTSSESSLEPFRQEADALAEQILGFARRASGGQLVWLEPTAGDEIRKLSPHLYTGFTGLALFFAARARVGDSEADRSVVRDTLAPLQQQLDRLAASPELAERQPFTLGALVGLGGYAYAFLRCGRWIDDPDLVDSARRIAGLITPERIAADEHLDVAQGAAGALLALLALHEDAEDAEDAEDTEDTVDAEDTEDAEDDSTTESPFLRRAILCADHLMARRVSVGGRPRAWSVRGGPPTVGFAHGASGIAHGLLRLAGHLDATDPERSEALRATAREGLAFETSLFDAKRGGWQVAPGVPRVWTSWCNGASGVTLGRACAGAELDDPEIEGEARAGVDFLRRERQTPIEHLCCGNLGRAEALREVARRFERPDLAREADGLTRDVLERSRERRHRYAWSERAGRYGVDISLFRGSAGAGYAALRAADPTLPCLSSIE